MTKRGAPQFPLRFPDGLREAIKASAKANGRTMNAEIVARLAGDSQLDRIEAAITALRPAELSDEDHGAPRGNRVPIMFSDRELEEIDVWRATNRVATRARAVRALVAAAIRKGGE